MPRRGEQPTAAPGLPKAAPGLCHPSMGCPSLRAPRCTHSRRRCGLAARCRSRERRPAASSCEVRAEARQTEHRQRTRAAACAASLRAACVRAARSVLRATWTCACRSLAVSAAHEAAHASSTDARRFRQHRRGVTTRVGAIQSSRALRRLGSSEESIHTCHDIVGSHFGFAKSLPAGPNW